MPKSLLPLLAVCLIAASPAYAQFQGGGGGGGHGGGGHGGRGGQPKSKPTPTTRPDPDAPPPETPLNAIEIVGVVQAVDAPGGRLTIAYEPVDALDWPKGTMPFVVSRPAMMTGISVGEKVRFKLASQQIWELKPY